MGKRKMVSCAACRVQRKKCSEQCILARYFPPDDPDKFAIVQRMFGTSHIVKLLQSVEVAQRADAVNSMVYEASARLKDPVHGCATQVHQLQKQIAELESKLADTQTELKHMRSKYDKLVLLLGTSSLDSQLVEFPTDTTSQKREDFIYEEVDPFQSWEPLWEQ